MTPKDLATWFATPGTATIDLTEALDMRGVTLKGSSKTIRGGELKRARIVATDSHFEGVTFNSDAQPTDQWFVPIGAYIDGSKRLTFDQCKFGGGTLEKGIGLRGNDVEDITITRSEFKDGYQGPSFLKAKRVTVNDCDIHHLGENGITAAGCLGLTILRNKIHDITPVNGAHPDAIQTWTYRQPMPDGSSVFYPVNDVVIEDNVIIQGEGMGMQGIFHRSRANALADTPQDATRCYNWAIRRNLIYGWAYTNAIYLNEGVDGVVATDNLVLAPFDATFQSRFDLKGCTNVVLERNVANMFLNCPPWQTANVETKAVALLIPDLAKRALATEAGLRLQAGGVRLRVG